MIPLPVRILAIVASGIYLTSVVLALRSSRMTVRQSLLWLCSGIVFFLLSVFPFPVIWVARDLGFVAPSNAAFVAWLLVLTGLSFHHTITTSRQAEQLKTLCQEIALLRANPERGNREHAAE